MKKMSKWDWTSICTILVCAIVLLPIFVIAKYNRPGGDDYDYAIQTYNAVKSGGGLFAVIKAAVETSKLFYNVWQGLYTSAFVLALQPGIYGEQYYSWSTCIIIGVCFFQLFAAVYILNKYVMKRGFLYSAAISSVVMTFIVLWMPSAREGLFWYNGAMNYLPWTFSNLLNICLMYDIYKTGNKKRQIILLIISVILSFIISGANHVTAFADILYLFAAVLILLPKKRWYAVAPLISACVGFVIMYKAPGTAIRQQFFVTQPVFRTMYETLKYVRELIGEWFAIEVFILFVLITPYVIQAAKKFTGKISILHVAFFTLVSVAVVCGMLCVPYYSMGNFGVGRLTNVVWVTFILESVFVYFLLWRWLISNKYILFGKIGMADTKKQLCIALLTACCVVALFILPSAGEYSNSFSAVQELRQELPQKYCAEKDSRIVLYEDPSLTEVAVKPLKTISPLLHSSELGTDPNVWPNTSISNYYGKPIYLDVE